MNVLEKALSLAALNPPVHVLPVKVTFNGKKYPLHKEGFYGASADPEVIRAMFDAAPEANEVGYWPGVSDLFVFDIDEAGWSNLDNLIDELGAWESCVSYRTRRNGAHHVYRAPAEVPGPGPMPDMPGIDRKTRESFATWYGDVPTQEQWDALPEPPGWMLTGRKRAAKRVRSTDAESASDAELEAWIADLSDGEAEPGFNLFTPIEHRDDLKAAFLRIVRRSIEFPHWPGTHRALEDTLKSFISSTSSVPPETRASNAQSLLKWALVNGTADPETGELYEDLSEVSEWIEKVLQRPAVPAVASLEVTPVSPATEADFWVRRPVLQHVYQSAYRAPVAPWGLLGALLQRVLLSTPAHVVYMTNLPASLNNVAAFIGVTGAGKSLTQRAVDSAFSLWSDDWLPAPVEPGSGEGLIDSYYRDEDWVPNHARLFGYDEVGALTARQSRQGTTIFETLKTAESGGALSRVLARGHGTDLPKDEYRFVLFVNAQPAKCGDLFSESAIAGGLPSRFVWFPTTDPNMRARAQIGPITKLKLTEPKWPFAYAALPEMLEAHLESTFAAHEGKREDIDSHAVLTRAKVAVAFAILDGRAELVSEDWELAGIVMQKSDETRASVLTAIRSAAAKETARQGRSLGVKTAVAEDTKHERDMKRVKAWIDEQKTLHPAATRKEIRRKSSSRDRQLFDDIWPEDTV